MPDITHQSLLSHSSDPIAVWAVLAREAGAYFAEKWSEPPVRKLFDTAIQLFEGKHAHYQGFDTLYHDLEHTLQVTLCWSRLAIGYNLYSQCKPFSFDEYLTGLAAALFHDAGYLKEKGDQDGTGAKFTAFHEERSIAIAREVLHEPEWCSQRLETVERIVATTGVRSVIEAIPFKSEPERKMGLMLCSADYLAQMSDPAYLQKLPSLYREFEEAARFHKHQAEKSPEHPNAESMIDATPRFWREFVIPRLEDTCEGMYRYLNHPYPNGVNPYLVQAEANIERILRRIGFSASGKFVPS